MKKIKIVKNGPYVVSGNVPLYKETSIVDKEGIPEHWEKGESFPNQETYLLCRCGKSYSKPFCDSSHIKEKFNGKETADNVPYIEKAEKFKGKSIDLLDAIDFCSIARFCDRQGQVWYLIGKDDEASKLLAIEECNNCPSGRLTAIDKNGNPIEKKLNQEISLTEDPGEGVSGPIWVKGSIPIISSEDKEYEKRNRATLCRCGKSKNKPFCDGTHIDSGFKA